MRKRFQNGRVVKSTCGRYWVGKWYEANGRDRSKSLGKVSKITKSKARELLAEIVRPINERATAVGGRPDITVKEFVDNVYLPFYRRKWKRVTDETRTISITHHIVGDLKNARCVP